MTTIAYRGGVMAADTGVWTGRACHVVARKLARGNDGTLYGCCGNAAEVNAFLKWVDGGYEGDMPRPRSDKDGESSFNVLKVARGGPINLITAYGEEEYEADYYSIGGGNATAFGALYAGATAEMAIRATIVHGSAAHGDVRSIRHDRVTQEQADNAVKRYMKRATG